MSKSGTLLDRDHRAQSPHFPVDYLDLLDISIHQDYLNRTAGSYSDADLSSGFVGLHLFGRPYGLHRIEIVDDQMEARETAEACAAREHLDPSAPNTSIITTALCGWCGQPVKVRL